MPVRRRLDMTPVSIHAGVWFFESRLHDAGAISFRLAKTMVMTSHNNFVLRLCISQKKGAKHKEKGEKQITVLPA